MFHPTRVLLFFSRKGLAVLVLDWRIGTTVSPGEVSGDAVQGAVVALVGGLLRLGALSFQPVLLVRLAAPLNPVVKVLVSLRGFVPLIISSRLISLALLGFPCIDQRPRSSLNPLFTLRAPPLANRLFRCRDRGLLQLQPSICDFRCVLQQLEAVGELGLKLLGDGSISQFLDSKRLISLLRLQVL